MITDLLSNAAFKHFLEILLDQEISISIHSMISRAGLNKITTVILVRGENMEVNLVNL